MIFLKLKKVSGNSNLKKKVSKNLILKTFDNLNKFKNVSKCFREVGGFSNC